MLRLLLQQRLQYFSCFWLVAQQYVKASEVEIPLIEIRRDSDARLESLLRLRVTTLPHEKHAEIVERIGILGAQVDGTLQMLRRTIHLIFPRRQHAHTVIDLRIVRLQLKRTPQHLLGLPVRFRPTIKSA